MDGWLANLAGVAWAQTWQLTVLIAIVWLTTRFAARNRPHLASILWLVVLLKCVTPPLWSSPSGVFCWLQRGAAAVGNVASSEAASAARIADAEMQSERGEGTDAVTVQVNRHAAPSRQPVSPLRRANERPAAAAVRGNPTRIALAAGLLLWLGGSGLYVIVAVARLGLCWRRLRRAGRVHDSELERLLQDLRAKLGVRLPVRLWVTASHVGPAVIGLLRPTVIVPAALVQGKSPGEVAPLLAHELMHIHRGDLWWGLLQTLAEGLWWFHPLVRLASRLFTRDAERCCDEAVIAHLACTPAAYARSLLDVLALKQQLQPVPSFPGVRPVDVTRGRLERIMQLRQGCRKRTPWWCWLVLAVAAAAALPGAALVVGAREQADTQADTKNQSQPADLINWNRVTLQNLNAEPDPASQGKLVVATYDLTDLVKIFSAEYELEEKPARTAIEWHVERSAPGPWKMKGFRVADPRTIAKASPGLREKLETNEKARFEHGWVDDKLIVVHTAAGQEQIERQLQLLRAPHGLDQLCIELRIISGPAISLDRIAANWKLIGATADSRTDELHLDEQTPEGGQFERGNVGHLRGAARTMIERQVPAVLALLDDHEVRLVLEAAQYEARTNVLQAPKVTVFNGQSVRFNDTTQRPFVVGIKPTKEGGEEPQIRVISEGSTIAIRPELQSEDKVLLDLGLTLSHIRSVETAEFPTGRSDAPSRVQVPEVGTTRIQSNVAMPLNQTLAISLPNLASSKTFKPGCLLITVRRIPQNEIDAAKRSQAHYLPKEAEPVAVKRAAAESNVSEAIAADRKPDLVERVYHVADLVVGFPHEPLVISLDGQAVESAPAKVVGPDFESLLELVAQTIAPQSWTAKGGDGRIEVLPNRLSLIVRQVPEVHTELADLFTQLRRLQDVQILWTAELLSLKLLKEFGGGPLAEVTRGKQRRVILHPAEAQSLRGLRESKEALRESEAAWASPKITLFNGQTLDLRLQPGANDPRELSSRLQLQSTVAADFRFVRVLSARAEETLGAGGPVDIPRGHSLLVDVSAPSANNASLPRECRWCLLTPQVLLMSREPYARVLSAQDSERPE